MFNGTVPFVDKLNDFFYEGMDRQTSGCLYGSAATGDWVASRSDLDLFVFVPEEKKLNLFDQKIKEWSINQTYPVLDGYVFFPSGGVPMAKRIDKFDEPARPVGKAIELIDLWNIKNRSKHLFGTDLKTCVQEISQEELRAWAKEYIERFWIPNIDGPSLGNATSLESKIPLSTEIWVASGIGRVLMLAKGINCSSKREALLWLADECSDIREKVTLLVKEFEKPDITPRTFSFNETRELAGVYLRLLRQVRP